MLPSKYLGIRSDVWMQCHRVSLQWGSLQEVDWSKRIYAIYASWNPMSLNSPRHVSFINSMPLCSNRIRSAASPRFVASTSFRCAIVSVFFAGIKTWPPEMRVTFTISFAHVLSGTSTIVTQNKHGEPPAVGPTPKEYKVRSSGRSKPRKRSLIGPPMSVNLILTSFTRSESWTSNWVRPPGMKIMSSMKASVIYLANLWTWSRGTGLNRF